MRKKINFNMKPALLLILAVMLVSYACTRVEDNSRSGSLLTVESVVGLGDPDHAESNPMLSDTCDLVTVNDQSFCTVVNDDAGITFSNNFLQIGPGSGAGSPSGTFLNDIIVNQYRVDYFRPNGRNTPGVDVPYGIDGTMNVRVPVNGTATGTITIVRHEAKLEPPLAELTDGIGEGVMTAQAQIKFYGQDLAGHTVSATGFLEIHFANFGEPQ